ncbi:GtrA family protein [Synechococcus sp. J7-Johnson]|uniref:GtrA family protein n=1 Tax=Synechococcus sp. J7-Johnson TaxID=2823737 RepID=UPI0037D9C3BF|nr:GtrA family protein [Synechococcus sp. J7-Johnson]
MRPENRLCRFAVVGISSTFIHAVVLYIFLGMEFGWLSNLAGFLSAFVFSFVMQQRFTFADKLAGKRLNSLAATSIFSINAVAASCLGILPQGSITFLLPIVPAMINYILYSIMSTSRLFASK